MAKPARRWSQRVTRESDALDLSKGGFTWRDPKRIAASLKRSAQRSGRRKADPFRSALSMLTFYPNRPGSCARVLRPDLPGSQSRPAGALTRDQTAPPRAVVGTIGRPQPARSNDRCHTIRSPQLLITGRSRRGTVEQSGSAVKQLSNMLPSSLAPQLPSSLFPHHPPVLQLHDPPAVLRE